MLLLKYYNIIQTYFNLQIYRKFVEYDDRKHLGFVHYPDCRPK